MVERNLVEINTEYYSTTVSLRSMIMLNICAYSNMYTCTYIFNFILWMFTNLIKDNSSKRYVIFCSEFSKFTGFRYEIDLKFCFFL